MIVLKSQPLVDQLKKSIKQGVSRCIERGLDPHLAVVLVGHHPESLNYIAIKTRVAKELGITVSLYHLEEDSLYSQVKEVVEFLNQDPEVHGIIIQLPLPERFTSAQTDELLCLVDSQKDVDGLRGDWQKLSYAQPSLAALLQPKAFALPPMVCAVISLMDFYNLNCEGKKVVIVGEGRLVGKPLKTFLEKVNCSVQTVDEETENILAITQQADILISGTGQKELVTYQWVKPGAIVIDCSADVHVDSVEQVASALAPAKGGVGPLTVVWLLHNTLQATLNQETTHELL